MDEKEELEERQEEEKVPLGQIIFDQYFLFFLLSLVISMVIYNIWGLMEVIRVPVLTP